MLLAAAPQVVHGVELRPLLGQPQQVDVQARSQLQRTSGGVAAGLVQQQEEGAPGIMRSQQSEEGLEVLLTQRGALENDTMAGERIESTEEYTLHVLPGDGHSGLLPSGSPRRA